MFRPYIKRTQVLVSIAVFNLILVYIVHTSDEFKPEKNYDLKVHASQIMEEALSYTYAHFKEVINDSLALELDVFKSGLIGVDSTDSKMTTKSGILQSKLSTTNPDFAALYIDYFSQIDDSLGTALTDSKIQDTIAVSLTGSFPGANIALLSACKASNVYPVIISSMGSSSYGANRLEMTWIDIENILFDKMFNYKSVAVSLGGDNDIAEELSSDIIRKLTEKIKKQDYQFINKISLSESIQKRMDIYDSYSKNYKAYINIGGSASSLGNEILSQVFLPGLNFHKDFEMSNVIDEEIIETNTTYDLSINPIVYRFESKNIPVINIKNINKLCMENHLPYLEIDSYDFHTSELFGVIVKHPLRVVWPCFIISLLILVWVVFSSIKQVNKKMEEIENDSIV